MIGKAACRGAATIVNAIATGRGAAFGITLEADALVELAPGKGALRAVDAPEGEGLLVECVKSILSKAPGAGEMTGQVKVRSEIPISRGLKSSSAVTNAVVLATARAVGSDMSDMDLILAGIEESLRAGVTVTGAFDDASACFLGGVAITDNRTFTVLSRGKVDEDYEIIIHVPARRISKASVKDIDFSRIRPEVEHAFGLAMKGELLKAMEANSRAYAKVLDVSEDAVDIARKNGALAAGISGTGPATVIVSDRVDAGNILNGLRRLEGEVLRAKPNETPAREVVPRLL